MTKLDELLKREMTRKQFILLILGSIVSLTGFSSFIGMLTHTQPPEKAAVDYGMRNYGP